MKNHNNMKKIISIAILALMCNISFAQTDVNAIYEKANSLNNQGDSYYDEGQFSKALKLYSQAAELTKDIANGYNIYYSYSISNIAISYYALGNYPMALKYLEQSAEIKKEIYGPEDPLYASALNNISVIYCMYEDYNKAIDYDLKALEIKKKTLGEDNPKYALSLSTLGSIYYKIGDYQNALKYQTQALNIYKNSIGEETPEYANTLNAIGLTYAETNEKQTALKYYVQALDIRKKVVGVNHPSYGESLNNVGTICLDIGDYQNALKFFNVALDITKEKNGNYAFILNNIGNTYSKMKNYSKALEYYLQAKNIWGKTSGESSSNYSLVLKNIAVTYSLMGDYKNAVLNEKQSADIFKKKLIRNFSYMTAHEREAYWNSFEDYFYETRNHMYYASDDTIATKIAYDSELISKGLLLASEISTTNIIKESGNNALISEYENMKKMHQQLNKELDKPTDEREFNCDSLENELQKKEKRIMQSCKEYGDVTSFISIGWKDIQKSMKDNDVAIEFTNVTTKKTTQFMALVLTKNMEAPVCLHLFEKSEMQKLQRGVAPSKPDTQENDENRGATTVTTKRQGIYESTGLYNMLWKPLEKYFPENPRIYFAPSGMLHQIAIEYAPTGDGKLISDKYEIYRVSSTRFLALDYMPMQMKNSVLYGGIYYDSDTTTMKRESNRYATRSANYTSFAAFNKDEERGSLSYLPGTKTEVEDIAGKMKGKQIATTLYEGSQANEESFKALSGKSISTLHIATHGFFLPTEEKLSGDQALIQSGLLMSGANLAWQNQPIPDGVEDGVLTAKEISYMDLRKTDLVVLSACQTALGEITGEGVFGLQRGFKKAGVRTIIMSLWPVDDNATLLMMTEFYSNLTKGMTKREAFLAAQNKVKNTAGFENPRYWAAFIMLDGNEN